jgi:DNA repair exonuclease SbcCD ATPase subunit
MRIDPPHEPDSATSPDVVVSELPQASQIADEPAAQQMRVQADQLANHLRQRQKELDRREAELNSRVARWESETRAARLAMLEHEDPPQRIESSSEIQHLRNQLLQRLQAWDEEVATMRQRMTAEHEQAMAEVERKRHDIQRRADSLNRCSAAIQQLRAELTKTQRETLEARLCMEELWMELSGAAPPAALTQSFGRVRAQLDEQYRSANAELAEQRKELEGLRSQITVQLESLKDRKQQFDRWVADRRDELQQQAARLAAREQHIRQEELRSPTWAVLAVDASMRDSDCRARAS